MSHETTVTAVPHKELLSTLEAAAAADTKARGVERHTSDTLLEGFVAEGYDGKTAYAASCSCGWQANNPLPSQGEALKDAARHEVNNG